MNETRVFGRGVREVGKAELLDTTKSLNDWAIEQSDCASVDLDHTPYIVFDVFRLALGDSVACIFNA
jgi:hypothetical protein